MILTGGASGIGRAAALRLAEEGCVLGIFDLDEAGAQATRAAVRRGAGLSRRYHRSRSDRRCRGVIRGDVRAGAGFGECRGLGHAVDFLDTDRALWDKVVQINLYGPLNMHHVVARGMAERGFGRVVNVASDAGRVGSSGEAVYAACKGGIIAFTKTLARELARKGVTLNVVCPARPTRRCSTISARHRLRSAMHWRERFRCGGWQAGRLRRDDRVPAVRRAEYMTGQTISVSGGLTMV